MKSTIVVLTLSARAQPALRPKKPAARPCRYRHLSRDRYGSMGTALGVFPALVSSCGPQAAVPWLRDVGCAVAGGSGRRAVPFPLHLVFDDPEGPADVMVGESAKV